MRNLIFELLFFSLLIMFCDKAFAQSETYKFYNQQWQKFVKENNWDSTLFYAKKLSVIAKSEYGEISFINASALSLLAKIYLYTDNYSLAYGYFKRAQDIFKEIKRTGEAQYQENMFELGMLCYSIGAYSEAETYLSPIPEVYKSSNIQFYTQSLLTLSSICLLKGEYAKAALIINEVQETLDTATKSPFIYYLLASSWNNLGEIYGQTGNMQKALFSMKKANEIGKKAAAFESNDNTTMLLNLADLYISMGFTDSAMKLCNNAERSLINKKNEAVQAEIIKTKALICMQQKKRYDAITLLNQYKSIFENAPVKPVSYYEALLNLTALYSQTKQFSAADSLIKPEVKKLRMAGLEYSYEMQQALIALCANLINEKRYIEAYDSLIPLCQLTFKAMGMNLFNMSESEKLHYKKGLDEIFNMLYICLYIEKDIRKDLIAENCRLELERNSMVLLGQAGLLSRIRNSNDTNLLALYNTWLDNKQILSKQYSIPVGKRIFSTDSLEDICEKLEKKVSVKESSFSLADFGSSQISRLPAQKPNSAAIEFVRFHYKTLSDEDSALYAAFIIKNNDSIPAFVRLCSEKLLTKILKDKNGKWIDEDQLTQKIYNSQSKDAAILYRLVWKPIEPYLHGVVEINYATSGLLNDIALHAIFNGRDYLLNKYKLHRSFSLSDFRNQELSYQKPKTIDIWGNMNYDSASYANITNQQEGKKSSARFSLIASGTKAIARSKSISESALMPFDAKEISDLKKICLEKNLHVNSYENAFATEENFKQQASSFSGILHISTHGFYDSLDREGSKGVLPGSFIAGIVNPLFRCGLAFSGVNHYLMKRVAKDDHEDGILTGYEVAQLDLHNVQLVTLSACETGLGDVTDNEGNLGLQRAFKLAGVNNMLVSLWQVPAKETTQLLSLFYNGWLNGKKMNEALRDAEFIMQKKGYPPYFWAGFVLIE